MRHNDDHIPQRLLVKHHPQEKLCSERNFAATFRNLWNPNETCSIFFSPYCRTKETLESFLKGGKFAKEEIQQIKSSVLLVEQKWGNLNRRSIEMLKEAPEYGAFYFHPSRGESGSEVSLRAKLFLRMMFDQESLGDVVIIVSHCGTLSHIAGTLLERCDGEFDEEEIENAKLVELVWDGCRYRCEQFKNHRKGKLLHWEISSL
jgi:broad specificity phosphatase PhoE